MSLRCCFLVLLAFAVSQVIGRVVSSSKCPDWGIDHPCKCKGSVHTLANGELRPSSVNVVECEMNRTSKGVAEALRMMSGIWYLELKLKHPCMSLNELPEIAIRKTRQLTLSHCETDGSEDPVPIEWPSLGHVEFDSLSTMQNPWSLIKGAKLNWIVVKGPSKTQVIGQDFRQQVSSEVIYLQFTNTPFHTIEPGSMTHLKDLTFIRFLGTPIKCFPRSALPEKLPKLSHFTLSNTLLEKLEPSFFDGMPRLDSVYLIGSKFTTLDSSWFTSWKKLHHVVGIYTFGNPLLCSCDLLRIQRNITGSEVWTILRCYDSAKNLQNVVDLEEDFYC